MDFKELIWLKQRANETTHKRKKKRGEERIKPRGEGSEPGTLHEQLHLMFLLLESGTVIGPSVA